MKKFKLNDRVRRVPYKVILPSDQDPDDFESNGELPVATTSTRGCIGTVKAISEETTGTSGTTDVRDRALMIQVLWDNGTLSVLGPEGLEEA